MTFETPCYALICEFDMLPLAFYLSHGALPTHGSKLLFPGLKGTATWPSAEP